APAAIATRSSAMVKGGSAFTATPTKKNDPPHRMESASSSDQSRGLMRAGVDIGQRCPGTQVPASRFLRTRKNLFPRSERVHQDRWKQSGLNPTHGQCELPPPYVQPSL